MRITIVSQHYAPELTGNAPYVERLAAALAARAHDVTVVTSPPFYPQWKISDDYPHRRSVEDLNGVTVVRLRQYVPSRPSGLKRLASEIHGGLRVWQEGLHDADAVLFVSPALFQVALASRTVGRRSGARWCVWVQDLYSLGQRETGGNALIGRLLDSVERAVLGAADSVVVIHERFADYVRDAIGVRDASLHTIRNWSHIPDAYAFAAPRSRQSLGLRESEMVVIHAGNQGKKQGLENVIAAAEVAMRLDVGIRFVLLGDGNQRERLEQMARNITSIEFWDPVSEHDFLPTLKAADVLLVNELPGLREMSVPSKLTSYFATGLPVVAATDRGSVTAQEVTVSGGGVVVPPGDPNLLIETLVGLRKDATHRAALGAAGLRYRADVLGQDVAVAKFEYVLSLLAGRIRQNNRS